MNSPSTPGFTRFIPLGIAALLISPVAAGQAQEEVTALEEIIVTAEKRESSIQDVAVSVTAFSGEMLQNFDIVDFENYVSMVPGLTSTMGGPVSSRGVRAIGLRGVQTLSGTIVNSQNTVGFYINNSPMPAANPRLVDMERIEVLRGPQGALYSANSMAGTIVLVTRAPTMDGFEGNVMASLSSTKNGGTNYDIEAALNIPLSERAALRLSAYNEQRSGYIDFIDVDAFMVPTGETKSNMNDMTAIGGRVALRVNFSDNFRLDASVMYSKRELDSQDIFNRDNPGLTWTGHFLLPRFDEFTLATLDLTWDIGSVRIISTTSFFDSDSDQFLDLTDSFGPLLFPNPGPIELPYNPYGNKNKDFTQEIRAQSTHDGRLQWLVGLFYTDREEISSTTLPAPPGKTSIFGVFPWLEGQPIFKNVSPRLRDETAVYAEFSYDVSDQWRIVAGARWFEFDFKTIDDFIGTTLLVPNNAILVEGTAKENGVVPKLRLEYRPNDDMLFFATAAEGFRMGGANFPIPTNLEACGDEVEAIFGVREVPDGYESDSLWSYELGGKMTFSEGRLRVNAAVYYIDWQDQQVPTGTLCTFSGAVLNVGKVVSKGAEVEITAALTDRLTFMISVSYIDAEVKEDFQIPGATAIPFAFKGDPLPDVPEWSVAVRGEYNWPAFGDWEGYVRADYRYVDERASDIRVSYIKDAYHLANLRVGVANGDWDFRVFIDNLTDERPRFVFSAAGFAGLSFENSLFPRTFGLSVRRFF